MIWKIIVTLSVALYVRGEEDAISEQRIVIHHQKSSRDTFLSHKEPKKSRTQDEYATAYPSYEFSYSVNDPKTRDIKGQHEKREGDEVNGNYWLIEPNGRKRTVNYLANDDNGFNAIIDYTASLKEEQKKENVEVNQAPEVNQGQEKDQGDIEKSKEEVIEDAVDEQVQDIEDDSGESKKNVDPAPVVENNSSDQNESDNQEEEANNVNERVDINYDLTTERVENLKNKQQDHSNISESSKENQAHNVIENGKRENLKRPKIRGHGRNNNGRKKLRNSMRVNQEDPKPNDNNKNSHKGKKSDHIKSLNVPQKNNIGDSGVTLNKRQKQHVGNNEQNGRKAHRFRNEENKGNNKPNDVRDNKNYAVINFSSTDEIKTKVDIPNNEETYEHRIRIYHPRNISARPKLE